MPGSRDIRFRNLTDSEPLDVLVIGGGMTGAPIYQKLCQSGYRVALVDKGDFSSGTSQASGMLVWGGLLYLKNLDFATVLKLCKARGELIRDCPDELSVLDLHYRFSSSGRRSPAAMWLLLHLYWLMGACALARPTMVKAHYALRYQEAMLRESDSRFVIDRIRGFDSEHGIPLNHCQLVAAEFDRKDRIWRVVLRDMRTGTEHTARAKAVINGAGVWTDEVNRILGIDSPYKHVFSKGVYLAFPNTDHQTAATVYPMHDRDDVMTHVPWGPVMMWGPTETSIRHLEEGLSPNRDDIRFLLNEAARNLPHQSGADEVISIRCGVRPLAVPRNFNRDVYPLDLSRRHQLVAHSDRRCLSLYGGKLTSSINVASKVAEVIARWLPARFPPQTSDMTNPERCPDSGFVTPDWARDHEYCHTLDDYLRRRTSIAQWTPRMGLGRDGSGQESLRRIARAFATDDHDADAMMNDYENQVRTIHDPLLDV
jgi:glycerol-3-phosphate dehydrogenase